MLWIPVFRTLLHLVFYCFSFPVFYNYIHFCFLCFRFRFLSSRQALKVYERRSPKGWLGHFLVPSSGLPVLLKPTYTDPGLSVQPRRTSNWRPLLSLWSRGLLRASLHSLPLTGWGGGGYEGCGRESGDLEWHGAEVVAMRVRRRIHGRYGHSVRLLQLHRFLVTPFTFSAALLCSA